MAISQMFAGTAHHALVSPIEVRAPSQATAGSLCFLVVSHKHPSASLSGSGLSGWTLLTANTGGGSTHGNVRLSVYYRIPTTSIANQLFTIDLENVPDEDDNAIAQIFCYTKAPSDGAWVTPPRFDIENDNNDNSSLSATFSNLNLQVGTASAIFVAASDSGGNRGSPSHNIPGTSTSNFINHIGPPSNELFDTQNGSNEYLSEWNKTFSSNGGGQAGTQSLLYQGDPQAGWKYYSKIRFNVGSDLDGKTITDVDLTMQNVHSWWNAGLDPCRIGTHQNFSLPSGDTSPSGDFNKWQFDWPKFATKSVDLPNSVGEDLRDGEIAGLTLGRPTAGGIDDYGYFDGDGSERPKLLIKWSQQVVRENPVALFASNRNISSGSQSGGASYSLSTSGGTLSGVAIHLAVETVTDEEFFIEEVFSTVEQFDSEFLGLEISELQSLPGDQTPSDTETITTIEFPLDVEGVTATDTDIINFLELDKPPLDEFSVVFNENPNNPGFIVTVKGLLGIDQTYDLIDVIRRDTSGRYPDERVRGMADVVPQQNNMVVTDYEAPLSTNLEYWVTLFQGADFLAFGPAIPTPQPFIPVQTDVYGNGLSYFKPIDIPTLGIPVQIEQMNTWTRPARFRAEHDVLGRRNKVIVSDVRSGREGEISGWIILSRGQTLDVFEAVINPGAVILIQNPNPIHSGYDDIYVQISDIRFQRLTPMVRYGRLDIPLHGDDDVIIRFEASFTEVDRPNPVGVVLVDDTWQVVNDTFLNWKEVKDNRQTWLDLLKRPNGPQSS